MMASNKYQDTDCGHTYYDRPVHTLPCRHKFCIDCVEAINGLMAGEVFSCPRCRNCSQYIRPFEEVYGISNPAASPDSEVGSAVQTGENHRYTNSTHIEVTPTSMNGGDGCTVVQDRARNYTGDVTKPVHNYSQSNRSSYQRWDNNQSSHNYGSPSAHSGLNEFGETNSIYGEHNPHAEGSSIRVNNDQNCTAEIRGKIPHAPDVLSDRASAHSVECHDSTMKNIPRGNNLWQKKGLQHGRDDTYCNAHDKPVYFHCNCDKLICASCKEGEHRYHKAVEIQEVESELCEAKLKAGTDAVPRKGVPPKICPSHTKAFFMICLQKCTLLCRDCYNYYHCTGLHIPLKNAGTKLGSMCEGYKRELKRLQNMNDQVRKTGQINMQALTDETETLKDDINAATERAKARLDDERRIMLEKIDETFKEKLTKCTEALDKVTPLDNFAQRAEETNNYFQAEVRKGEFVNAMPLIPQIEGMMKDLDHSISELRLREEHLGLYMKNEEPSYKPIRLTNYKPTQYSLF